MGFHVVFKTDNGLGSIYLDNVDEIIEHLDKGITEESLIYEAEKDWKPCLIKDHEKIKEYLKYSNKMGLQGEKCFEEYMDKIGYPMEKLTQTKEQHDKYVKLNNGNGIKSPDYIVQSLNICVEVKAQTFKNYYNKKCCCINNKELEKLLGWQSVNKQKMFLFIFEIIDKQKVDSNPYIISIDEVEEMRQNRKLHLGNHYCYQIPIECCLTSDEFFSKYINK